MPPVLSEDTLTPHYEILRTRESVDAVTHITSKPLLSFFNCLEISTPVPCSICQKAVVIKFERPSPGEEDCLVRKSCQTRRLQWLVWGVVSCLNRPEKWKSDGVARIQAGGQHHALGVAPSEQQQRRRRDATALMVRGLPKN